MTTQALSNTILDKASLIAYWKMDETSGATVADSEGSYDGTIAGTPTLGAGSAVDDGGAAIEFTDTAATPTQYVSVASMPALTTFAIGGLFQPGTEVGTDAMYFLSQDTSQTTTDAVVNIGVDASGYPEVSIVLDDDTTITATSSTLCTAETWMSIGATWDGTTLTLWVDGVSAGTAVAAAGTPAYGGQAGSYYIGCGMNSDGSLVLGAQGRVDHLFVCNASTDFDTAADWAEIHQDAFNHFGEVVTETADFSEVRTSTVRRVLSLSDNVDFSDSVVGNALVVLTDGVDFADSVTTKMSFNPTVQEVLLFTESVVRRTPVTVTESILLNEVLRASIGLTVSDSLQLVETLTSKQQAELADVISFSDELFRQFSETVTEGLEFSESANFKTGLVLADAVAFADVVANTRRVPVEESDGVTFNELVQPKQTLHQMLTDGVVFGGAMVIDDTEYNAWVVNTKNEAPHRYSAFPYNSFAGDRAAKSDGIYKFTEDADSGTAIDAFFETGFLDFNISALKKIPDVYLYAQSDGRTILRVTTSERGERTTDWYEAAQVREDEDAIRYKPGKGLKTRYVKFRIENTEGKSLEIDEMEVRAVKLSRRIR